MDKINVFTPKTKDELLFNSYKKKVQKGGNDKNISIYQYELANCYMNGIGVNINHEEAIHYFKISAERGHTNSQYYLSYYYDEGKYIEKNIDEAIKWCKKSADQNNDLAQNQLGCYYEIGTYIDKNIEEACNLYKKSAIQGNVSAQYNLASCYEYGRLNGDKNMTEAFKWYYKSAIQDYHRAQNKLGWFYENGLGTEKNITEAVKWYKKSSKHDNCKAHYNLGNCYKYNKGIEKHDINFKIAFRLYDRAIEQGCKCEDTVYEYALCYENGEGVEKDMVKAFTLYKQAALLDYPIACYKVAECYKFGRGTVINTNKAMKWCEKAKNLGYKIPINLNTSLIENRSHVNSDTKNFICEDNCDDISDDSDDSDDKYDDKYDDKCIDSDDNNDSDDKYDDKCIDSDDCNDICDDCNDICDNCNDICDNTYDECKDKEADVKLNNSKTQIELLKNKNVKLLKQKEILNSIITNHKLILENSCKELLVYYSKKLDIVRQYIIDNNIYNNTYNNTYDNVELNTINNLYLRYNYNCGVLNHRLGNYEEAINFYEEAAYNKYPIAQKALSYCYKYGIYYEKSLETSKIWYNLYLYKTIEDVD
jgi:TPR repeat protein